MDGLINFPFILENREIEYEYPEPGTLCIACRGERLGNVDTNVAYVTDNGNDTFRTSAYFDHLTFDEVLEVVQGRKTCHAETYEYADGFEVDICSNCHTTQDDLDDCFPEFAHYTDGCKFRDCNHTGNSSVCAVARAVSEGHIAESRHKNYLEFYKQLSQRKEWKK